MYFFCSRILRQDNFGILLTGSFSPHRYALNTMNINIFEASGADSLIERINKLTPDAKPLWGKMNVAQMLAHSSRPFETVYDPAYAQKYPRPNAVARFFIRLLVKNTVVGPKPYKKNLRTAPEFLIKDDRDFNTEKERLITFINQAQAEGASAFEGREAHAFGPLTAAEWNMLFSKHTDHHLQQFGV